ncbi:MAG: hypothetical protein WCK09_17625 [Bacteroidota bacterium]
MKKITLLFSILLFSLASFSQMRVVDLWVPNKTTTFKQVMPKDVSFVYMADSNKTYRLTAKFELTQTMNDVFVSGNYMVSGSPPQYLQKNGTTLSPLTLTNRFHLGSIAATANTNVKMQIAGSQITRDTISIGMLSVGDSYGGGIIFYILKAGDIGYDPAYQKGLIAATADIGNLSDGTRWGSNSFPYGSTSNTATGIGTGQANTNKIIAIYGDSITGGFPFPTVYAAKLCNNLVVNGYSDWYLPSKDEIYQLSLVYNTVGGFNFWIKRYWSSSEAISTSSAWVAVMQSAPAMISQLKNATDICVRAVRSFSIQITQITGGKLGVGTTSPRKSVDIKGSEYLKDSLFFGTNSHGTAIWENTNATGELEANSNIKAVKFTSTVGTDVEPYSTSSMTLNTNLNADMVDGEHYGGWNESSSMWVLTNRMGWVNNDSSSMSFNAADSTLTLTKIGPLRYIRKGVICNVVASQTKKITGNVAGKSKSYFFMNTTGGILQESQVPWTLEDTKVPFASVDWDKSSYGKYLLHDERHTCLIDREMHYYLHATIGSRYVSGGVLAGYSILPGTATSAANTFSISQTKIADEDLDHTLAALTDPTAPDHAYLKYYRTSAIAYKWDTTGVPYPYSATYIQYDNAGTMTTGQNNRFYNSYLCFSNIAGIGRYLIIPGRGEFTTGALANAEDPKTFDWTGFEPSEVVIMYRLTWSSGSTFTGALGRVKLNNAPQLINQSISSAAVAVAYTNYDENVYAQGLRWNQNLDTYTRLGSIASAVKGASPGDGALPVQSKMKGCLLLDNGTVNYYLQEDDWTKKSDGTGSTLTGADGQVMVEIPKFYQKYVYLNNTVEWWISLYPLSGYTVHPAFLINGVEKPYLYYSAYEGVLYDVSATSYKNGIYLPAHSVTFAAADSSLTTAAYTNPYTSLAVGDIIVVSGTTNNNATFVVKTIGDTKIKVTTVPTNETAANTVIQTQRDYTATTGDKLSSVSGKVPLTYFTRSQSRTLVKNHGLGWHQVGYDEQNALELLILIEYGTFYIQNIAEVGPGITGTSNWAAYNNYNPFAPTGNGNVVGNLSADNAGAAACATDKTKYSKYRGIENLYGHVWKWTDGINVNANVPYVTSNWANWADDTAVGYDATGVTLANADGYQNTLVNSSRVMLPATVGGTASASLKITDYYYQSTGWRVALFGGSAHYGGSAGPWFWDLLNVSGYAYQYVAARVAF